MWETGHIIIAAAREMGRGRPDPEERRAVLPGGSVFPPEQRRALRRPRAGKPTDLRLFFRFSLSKIDNLPGGLLFEFTIVKKLTLW